MGLCTAKEGIKKLQILFLEGKPLLITKDAKSLGALVTTALNPKSFIVKRRIEHALLAAKRLQQLPIELHKQLFITQK